ncbi:UNVERIFIED_CONTAM: hypothetical protein PYX00_000507 [Menopon gallinae]|uniref:Phosphotransferase n=1 Tax=Menopon gallinae TaxID=328185 RepID=A0AAW2I9H5_9NEOP
MVLYHHLYPEVINIVRPLILEDEKLKQYSNMYKNAVGRSLDEKTADDAGIQSFVSHVNKLPTGQEKGNYLSLDFSGPVISILLLEFSEASCYITVQKFNIPQSYMLGRSTRLFDFIAKCLTVFLKKVNLKKMARIPLGVTFGFPIEQVSLQDCILLRWTKGFQCNDMIGQNVFTKLKDSFRKFPELKRIYIIGILNETVSVLLSATVQDPSCRIGIVVGQVASCCYTEKVSRIVKYQAKTYGEKNMYMILDSGAFGEDGSLDQFRTEFDFEMDDNLKTKGKLINEKMTGMAYLGEIARLALVRCIDSGCILGGKVTSQIKERDSINYKHMMRIESDPEDDHSKCREVLSEFGYEDVSDEDCCQVQFICRCVSRRAANLIAAQLTALMNRINEPNIAIALEGEMLNEYPNFEWYLIRKLNQLKRDQHTFQIIKLEPNGAARGAGVMAAVFGEEVMDRDEKLRRLPGFPVTKCHFKRIGKCLNPNCSTKHPCDTAGLNPLVYPMKPDSADLGQKEDSPCFDQSNCQKKPCHGYDQL